MSVKLIVVALLAAAATTGRAADEDPKADTLVIKTCPKDTVDCACATSADNTKNYTVGKCTADGAKSWMLDGCDAMVVKVYHNEACDLETFELKTACEAISYHKAECSGSDNTVKLYAGCNTNKCGTGKGVNGDDDNGCKNPTTFTIGGTDKCLKAGNKYYKLASTKCPASGEAQTVSFTQHLVQGCTDKGESVAVPMTCTATGYQKVSCSDAGVSIDVCKNMECDDGCTSTKIPLKEYKKAESGDYLYVDSCPPATANNVTFQVYADVKKYELGCKNLVEATCGTTTTTTITEATTTTETDPTINTNDSSSNNSSDDSTGSGIIAPAHSVGVLALVLCVLACVY